MSRVFNQVNLGQMLAFRKAGWTYTALAELFDCDFSTIYHHCKRYKIEPVVNTRYWKKQVVTPNIICILTQRTYEVPIESEESKWYIDEDGEKLNRGKNYRDYFNDYIKTQNEKTITS